MRQYTESNHCDLPSGPRVVRLLLLRFSWPTTTPCLSVTFTNSSSPGVVDSPTTHNENTQSTNMYVHTSIPSQSIHQYHTVSYTHPLYKNVHETQHITRSPIYITHNISYSFLHSHTSLNHTLTHTHTLNRSLTHSPFITLIDTVSTRHTVCQSLIL